MNEPMDFEAVMTATQTLLTQVEEQAIAPDLCTTTLAKLLAGPFGGRGFFAVYLTLEGTNTVADLPPAAFMDAFRQVPEGVAAILVKNLAMSTAMVEFHQRAQDLEQAEGSTTVQRRCRGLIQCLQTPELLAELQAMATSLDAAQGSYTDFLDRWQYDAVQRQAIARQVQEMLAIFTNE